MQVEVTFSVAITIKTDLDAEQAILWTDDDWLPWIDLTGKRIDDVLHLAHAEVIGDPGNYVAPQVWAIRKTGSGEEHQYCLYPNRYASAAQANPEPEPEPEAKWIYIVTQGSYSDYHVVDVFDDKEMAQAVVDSYNAGNPYDESRVEEYVLNSGPETGDTGLYPYCVWMERNGDTVRVEQGGREAPNWLTLARTGRTTYFPKGELSTSKIMETCMFARNEEHAVKIANERRTMAIAKEEWGKDD